MFNRIEQNNNNMEKRKSISFKNVHYRADDKVYVYLSPKYQGEATIIDVRITSWGSGDSFNVKYTIVFNENRSWLFDGISQEDIYPTELEFDSQTQIYPFTRPGVISAQIAKIERGDDGCIVRYRYRVGKSVFYFDRATSKIKKGEIKEIRLSLISTDEVAAKANYILWDCDTEFSEDQLYPSKESIIDYLTSEIDKKDE